MKRRAKLLRIAAGLAAAAAIACSILFAIAAPRATLTAPPPSAVLLDHRGRYLAEVGGDNQRGRGFWPLAGVPERVAAATIAIEDQRFWDHPGVDLLAIARALRQNTGSGRRVSGASTLAMQIARMQEPGERNYQNKLLEAATAILLTARYGREEILAHYLRIAPYANQIHGIGLAAERYFGKPVEDLSWEEIAFLTAIPQSPSRMNPYDWRGYGRAKRRAEQILVLLRRRGVTGEAEDGLARAELERIAVQPKPRRAELALHAVLRIEELLAAELRAGVDHPLRLSTTLDLELQEQVALAAEETVAALASAGAENGAVIVAERETGAVLAYVGSTGYLREDQGGAIDFARTPRSAGSTLKPFIFAAALEKKVIGPTTILDDLSRGPSGLINMDQNYLGPMLPRAALGNSRNVPAARLLEELGVGRTYDVLGDLSLHRRELPADHYGTGLAVGALPVTLEDLAAAYGALAREGGWSPLSYWPEQRRVTRRIFSEHTARQVTSFLSDPLARLPTFPRLGPTEYRFPVAIKTGTSQGFRDAWTVAYSARFLVAAWIGRPDARPMHNLTGLRSAAILVRRVLEPLHAADAQGLRDLSFPAPDGHRPVRVCGLSGHRATPACDHTFVEHLEPAAAAAIEDCPVHVAPGMVELPPKYARWAAEQYFTASPAGKSFIEPAEELVAPAIVQPERGSRVWIDPETPPELSTLALEVEVEDSVEEIVWWVDGQPFAIVHAPFTARWPLSRGRHVFEARIPYTPYRSDPVAVIVE